MSRVVISDGIALIELGLLQRKLLNRPYIAFEVRRIIAVYKEVSPRRRELGSRKLKTWLFFAKVGEYVLGTKKVIYIGSKKGKCCRLLLLNPGFDEIYLGAKDLDKLALELGKYASRPDLMPS